MRFQILSIIGMLIIVALISCVPANPNISIPGEAPSQPALPEIEESPVSSSTATGTPVAAIETSTVEEPPVAETESVATSRGDKLEATDPGTFKRDSGELQLVEFFAFW